MIGSAGTRAITSAALRYGKRGYPDEPPSTAERRHAPDQPLRPSSFERRDPGPTDVAIEILYCGVCHSDLHTLRDEWGGTLYPCVPGHEIVGRVTAVGAAVKDYQAGDLAGVGCMVDSDRTCAQCRASF